MTVLTLQGLEFEGIGLSSIHAYTGSEAVEAVRDHPDAFLILLDVVMESEHAGLEAARIIRQNLDNGRIRIVLRTGQAGQAPEASVVRDFDINDYREKTDLTAQRLHTLILSCLRSYRDISTIERTNAALLHVLEISSELFQVVRLEVFGRRVLARLEGLLHRLTPSECWAASRLDADVPPTAL